MMTRMLDLIQLYEPDIDGEPIYSAVYLSGDHYVEVRVFAPDHDGFSHVWESPHTGVDSLGRITCWDGTELISGTFTTKEAALDYFWTFVNDPEWGLMEATI